MAETQRADSKSVVKEIAQALKEKDKAPIAQIHRIVELVGEDFARENLEETLKIESEGGMMTQKGDRRRTPGGVYFYIVKGKLEPEMRHQIFPGYGQAKRGAVIEWEKRVEIMKPMLENPEHNHGRARIANVTIQGKVGHVEEIEDSIITTILHNHENTPTYPRGVPRNAQR